MKEGLLELKGAQKHENSMVCEISQPKIAPAKMALGCEMISQPKALLCETLLWHTSAISQHSTLISQLRNGLRKGLRKCPFAAKSTLLCEN